MQQREYALIDLRSDTLTTPSPAMREAMLHAAVGDDVYAEDPTVIALQEYAAALLEKEAALYAPSGTQSNLLALFAHCDRGDEYIVGDSAHTFRYEGGGAAILGSIPPQPIPMAMDGTLGLDTIEAAINPDDFHFARSRLICP
jgi:threonine aldolase